MAAITISDISHPLLAEIGRMKASMERLEAWVMDAAGQPGSRAVKPATTCRDILGWVSYEWNIPVEEILKRQNSTCTNEPRYAAMYLAKKLTKCSLPQIGRQIGAFHHSSVFHAIAKTEHRRKFEPDLDRRLTAIELRVNSTEK